MSKALVVHLWRQGDEDGLVQSACGLICGRLEPPPEGAPDCKICQRIGTPKQPEKLYTQVEVDALTLAEHIRVRNLIREHAHNLASMYAESDRRPYAAAQRLLAAVDTGWL